jgi:oxygen-dependent protoporphyrinogen oxidase
VPWGIDLCRRLGIVDDLVGTSEQGRQAFVVRCGRLRPIPDGFILMAPSKLWPILKTPILSPLGKLRLAWEYFVPQRREENGHDESLASFVRRRLGRETFDRLVQPLVAGIYTADPEKLSLAATLPRFQDMEREHGSLIRATLRQRHSKSAATSSSGPASGARYGLFVTPRAGLSSIVNAIAARQPPGAIQTNATVRAITRTNNRWLLNHGNLAAGTQPTNQSAGKANVHKGGRPTSPPAELERNVFDALVVAAPAPVASRLLANAEPALAADLASIDYAGAVVVSVAFDRNEIRHSLDGFGFVVPAIERRRILSASFSSVKFPGRAPTDKVLIRTFVGGACQRELCDSPDDELEKLVHHELGELLGITGRPLWTTITRWSNSMPQYHVGHLDRVERIEARVICTPGLALAGNAYRGVGVPHAIHSGEQAAEAILKPHGPA